MSVAVACRRRRPAVLRRVLCVSVVSSVVAVSAALSVPAVAAESVSGAGMPSNPGVVLPERISPAVDDADTVVADDLAVDADGVVRRLSTGEVVSDPAVVGTVDSPPDPLDRTDGGSFVPVSVGVVRDAMDGAVSDGAVDAASDAGVPGVSSMDRSAEPAVSGGLQNMNGAYWGLFGDTKAFFQSDGTLFVQQASGVVDVSEHNGEIDWAKVKAAGVDGAIIRLNYGYGNGFDRYALRNISECRRLGIPFGLYMYSYAPDEETARLEGAGMAELMARAGVSPSDLAYPVYYDLERWVWTGHKPPTDPDVYDGIVDAWFVQLEAAGFSNLGVYSYTGYLNTALDSERQLWE